MICAEEDFFGGVKIIMLIVVSIR